MVWLRTVMVAVVLVVTTLVLLPFQLVGLKFDLPIARRIPRWWHWVACRVLGIKVRVHGRLETRRPLMLAPNHASWLDILVLGSIAEVAYIAKSEVRGWPVFGHLARWQNSVFIEREQKRSTGKQVSEIALRMAKGEVIVLFAEGTTGDGNRVLPFKTSLFGAATSALGSAPEGIVYIQPVAIAYTGYHGVPMGRYHRPVAAWVGDADLLPHLAGILRAGAFEVDISFGEPLAFTAETKRKDAAVLLEDRVRTMLQAHLHGRDID
jgi:lyso-ornithine lipid O-acyltransferase